MSIGISLTILGRGIELYKGGGSGKYSLLSLSFTLLTIGIEFAIKV